MNRIRCVLTSALLSVTPVAAFAQADWDGGGGLNGPWPAQPHNYNNHIPGWDGVRLGPWHEPNETFRVPLPPLVPALAQAKSEFSIRPGQSHVEVVGNFPSKRTRDIINAVLAAARSGSSMLPPPLVGIDFVGESFYMGYTGLALQERLSRGRTDLARSYLAKRTQVVADLRERLKQAAALGGGQPTELAELNAAFEPVCLELEKEAESIRQELTSRSFWRPSVDETWIPKPRPEQVHENIIYRAISGAQFDDGLSTEQRWLLTETALEHRLAIAPIDDPTDTLSAYTYFVPATSRIRLPVGISEETRDKISRLTAEKTALKEELLAAISRERSALSARTMLLRQLAEKQAPRWRAIEVLADEIRRELTTLPYPDAPVATGLPPQLNARVSAALARKAALQRELHGRVAQLTEDLPGYGIAIVPAEKSLQIVATPQPSGQTAPKNARWQEEIAAFNEHLARSYADLATEMNALRAALKEFARTQPPGSGKNLGQLAREFVRSYEVQERWARYHDYSTAVLLPGLAPAVRRVLFSAALADLQKSVNESAN